MPTWSALILTGGRSSRLGRDKAAEHVGGRPLLARVLGSVPTDIDVVVAGPPPVGAGRPVRVCREDPPGGGPVAGIAAALPLIRTDIVVVLATDLPFLGDAPAQLAAAMIGGAQGGAASAGCDAVLAVDADGRHQPLCAAYRTDALRRGIALLPTPAGASMRALVATMAVQTRRPTAATVDPTFDVDTPADLRVAESRAMREGQGEPMMQEWVDAVQRELGLPGPVDIEAVLDVAKDVAHGVQRPAAPVSTYLLGLAVGAGADPAEAAAKIRALAASWVPAE